MKKQYYTIVVSFKTKQEKIESFKDFLLSVIEIALQSPGCIKHELHQSLSDPTRFMFYENWETKQAHQQHIVRPEVQVWRAQLDEFLEQPYEASVWEVVR